MLDNLEFTARIRPALPGEMDELPEDMHHDYTVRFDAGWEYFDLCVRDDRNLVKRIPLTVADLEAITKALMSFNSMKAEAANA